ncbi:MAG: D-sedoheptulose 7-phosphate isomerase [Gaiellaceae bacterium]|jgi:D-sedoheptulose 7-phosphate isomerase|nr:D-sedoheptulose 7-phosphate isomerase [Gaiellaceae bacterium]
MADARQSIADHLAVAGTIEELLPQVEQIVAAITGCYAHDHRVYTFGNGGSAADSLHFAEELVARFKRERRPLAAQSFAADPTVLTCIANDYEYDEVFARQVRAFARRGDVVIGFTTSGRSPNVVRGLAAAREAGATTVLFGGGAGIPAADHADHALVVPSASTARVQEMHVLLLHLILDEVDEWATTV